MSPPQQMSCSNLGCEYVTPPSIPSYELVLKALDLHIRSAHSSNHSNDNVKIEKPKRPSLTTNMSESDWTFFIHKWDRYKRQTKLSDAQLIDELWACLDNELERLAFNDGTDSTSLDCLLSTLKTLAVTTLHPSVHIVALHKLQQLETESTKAFSARVKGIANNCQLTKKCTKAGCLEDVSFVEETCYHVTMAGLISEELREKVLTQAMLGTVKDLPTLLNFTSAEESSKQKSPLTEVANISKRHIKKQQNKNCNYCGLQSHGAFNKLRIKECKAYGKSCSKCSRPNHFASVCKSQKQVNVAASQQETQETADDPSIGGFLAQINASESLTTPESAKPVITALQHQTGKFNALPMPHHIFDRQVKKWKKASPQASPVLEVTISLDRAAYKELKLNLPDLMKKTGAGHSRARRATMDTGAQLTVINEQEIIKLGIKLNSIFPVALSVNTVTKTSIDLLGGVFLRFSTFSKSLGKPISTRQLCYVSRSVKGIYLSEEASKALGCVPAQFPTAGACAVQLEGIDKTVQSEKPCVNTGVGSQELVCSCPKRTLPPEDEPKLPCEPTVENLPRIRQYILQRYASSAFNCCEHQALPLMDTAPPLRLFVDQQATPVAVMSPSPIPIHWTTEVKAGLDRDVALGVIEKVPVNDPVRWCSRMVVTPKTDGTPRRVIDFTPINRHAPRQAHHTRSPYNIATSVPGNMVKTVLDNWHGYHSVPIHPDDRHLTTFITPYGRYRYRTVPQGFISAGDGYTQRMDIIVEGTDNFDHCVDDSILWSPNIEENFHNVCRFIEKCAKSGCIFNPKKFQFAQDEVDFLGFRITKTGIKPSSEFMDSIASFPTPQSLTDVRSWFGTINQISYAFAIAPHMEPFRKLLSSKVPFFWSDELQKAFEASKAEIIDQCSKGVRNFEPYAPAALATDWSKLAVGCWLTQKKCECDSVIPGCCPGGWQTIHVASKFNSPAVSRYHPVEGEAFAASWALEKCKLFILGHPNLKLVVDHKPLISILGPNQELSEVINPRLMNFKLKSMAYRFTPLHLPGKKHVVPDTMSRRLDSPVALLPKLPTSPPETDNVQQGYADSFGPPSWVSAPTDINPGDNEPKICSVQDFDNDEDHVESLYLGNIIATTTSIAESATISNLASPKVITWENLKQSCLECEDYVQLRNSVINGFPKNKDDWTAQEKLYERVYRELSVVGPIIMLNNRVVIPHKLRTTVLQHLHACHSGVNAMIQRALVDIYWPQYKQDIINFKNSCLSCATNAPSNPAQHSSPEPDLPQYPFQVVCTDFFTYKNRNYLILVDKYSNWLSVMLLQKDDSKHVIKALREYFTFFGVCETLCSDGALVFTSNEMQQFCKLWGINQRISSAYYPTSNKRAEVGVKSAKRIIRENVTPQGSLNSDLFARALLMHRNLPDPVSKVSPAQIVFGRSLRDHIPKANYTPCTHWKELAAKREECFIKRHYLRGEKLDCNARKLKDLVLGDHVYVQDQTGQTPRKWNKSGVILESLPHNSYLVKIDGSNKVTKRNRQFLRSFVPFQTVNKAEKITQQTPEEITAASLALCALMDTPLTAAAGHELLDYDKPYSTPFIPPTTLAANGGSTAPTEVDVQELLPKPLRAEIPSVAIMIGKETNAKMNCMRATNSHVYSVNEDSNRNTSSTLQSSCDQQSYSKRDMVRDIS